MGQPEPDDATIPSSGGPPPRAAPDDATIPSSGGPPPAPRATSRRPVNPGKGLTKSMPAVSEADLTIPSTGGPPPATRSMPAPSDATIPSSSGPPPKSAKATRSMPAAAGADVTIPSSGGPPKSAKTTRSMPAAAADVTIPSAGGPPPKGPPPKGPPKARPTSALPRPPGPGSSPSQPTVAAASSGRQPRQTRGDEHTIDQGPPSARHAAPAKSRQAAMAAELASTAPDPLAGKVLAGCELKRLVGKGGMASVYLARQKDLDRDVAVKILSARLTKDPRQVQQFFSEAKTLARLEHSNIVSIYNVGQEEELCFLVMQLVQGGSLKDLMVEKGGRFPAAEACALVMQMAAGLAEAHRKGICHRDVKPGNVLVAPGPTLKITDFGLAAMADEASQKFGEVVGTPAYMSPEQADGRGVDTRTDIYGLGATFYHMLVGEPPFTGSTPEILLAHVNQPLVPPHERDAAIPEGVSRIVCKMMAKLPQHRYATLDEVVDDLRHPAEAAAKVAAAPPPPPAAVARLAIIDPDGALPPIEEVLGQLDLERPKTVKYGALALAAAMALFALVGIAPLMEIIRDARAEEEAWDSPDERQGALALESIEQAMAPDASPRLTDAEALDRYRALAQELPGTRASNTADERLRALQAKVAEQARRESEALLGQAQALEQGGKLGEAIDLLVGLTPAQRERAGKVAVDGALDRLRKALAERGFARVSPGEWLQGDQAERSTLPGFYMGLREVTCGEYARFLEKEAGVQPPQGWRGRTPPASNDLPVTGVTLEAALAYARFAGARLPTAAEWEKAARGTDGRTWPWGTNRDASACNWRRSVTPGRPANVGQHRADVSPWGCLDMAGNVAELTLATESAPEAPRARVAGGCFLTRTLLNCRAAFSREAAPGEAHVAVGFRVAADALPGAAR